MSTHDQQGRTGVYRKDGKIIATFAKGQAKARHAHQNSPVADETEIRATRASTDDRQQLQSRIPDGHPERPEAHCPDDQAFNQE